jgi:hypothetical protein
MVCRELPPGEVREEAEAATDRFTPWQVLSKPKNEGELLTRLKRAGNKRRLCPPQAREGHDFWMKIRH